MRVLVTGSAGFIGYHLCERLLDDGHHVIGFDAMSPYYDITLKRARLTRLEHCANYTAVTARIEDEGALDGLVADYIVHLAGQAGVRYGLENPKAYIDSNLVGSWRLLEHARQTKPRHMLIASSSSIYGANAKVPFEEEDRADEPLSLYAATKKGMEAMAHAYAHLHAIPLTAFRFFTVYGPWGRPDMALFKFTRAILAGEAIEVYGGGQMQRDFTYIDDLVEAIMRLISLPPSMDSTPYRAINVGGGHPVGLNDFINILEEVIGRKAIRHDLPMQPGDVPRTYASPTRLMGLTGYVPGTPLRQGIEAFVSWYRGYYGE